MFRIGDIAHCIDDSGAARDEGVLKGHNYQVIDVVQYAHGECEVLISYPNSPTPISAYRHTYRQDRFIYIRHQPVFLPESNSWIKEGF